MFRSLTFRKRSLLNFFINRINATVISIVLVSVCLFLVFAVTIWGTFLIKKELDRERKETINTLLLHTVRIIKPHIKLMVRGEIEHVAEELLVFEFIKGVRIVWQEPSIYRQIRELDIMLGKNINKEPKQFQIVKGNMNGEIISKSIFDGTKKIATLEVAIDDSIHEHLLKVLWTKFLIIGLFVSIIISFLLYFYYYLVSRPVLNLAEHMKKSGIKLIPFKEEIAPKEIKDLINSYNYLIESLKHYRKDLINTVKHWQQEVQRAENASRAKTEFLANITHELRTPLTVALGMTELIKEESLTENQKKYIQNLEQSLKTLSELIEDVLSFARLEREKEVLQSEVFDLNNFLEEIIKIFKPAYDNKQLKLRLFVDKDVPRFIEGDQVKLRQILINLLSNALKFTPQGAVELRVTVKEKGEDLVFLHFEVRDTGIGIPPDALEKIFIPFERLEHKDLPGTGLGLSICQHLVSLLKGEIWAESPGEGQGASFHVVIPFRKALSKKVSKTLDFPERLSGKVLLAEDNPMTQHFFVKTLEKLGLSVEAVSDGREALRKALSREFDLVLLDIRMPGLDGLEVARRLRQEGFDRPILALTAHAVSEMEAESIRVGMDGFITKPIGRKELARRLSQWLS